MADRIANTLLRTEEAYKECQSHLHESGAVGSLIESFLTEHILILLCADMQQDILDIADRRASKASDAALREFVSTAGKRVLRGQLKNEIAAFIGSFGTKYKRDFNAALDERDVQLYNNAVQERNLVAHHRHGSTIGFGELGEVIAAARNILASIDGVLLT